MLTRRDMLKLFGALAIAPAVLTEEWLEAASPEQELIPFGDGRRFALTCHGNGTQDVLLSKMPAWAFCEQIHFLPVADALHNPRVFILNGRHSSIQWKKDAKPARTTIELTRKNSGPALPPLVNFGIAWALTWVAAPGCDIAIGSEPLSLRVSQEKPSNWATSLIIYK